MNEPDITVVVPTHKPRRLEATLAALVAQTDARAQIIVVENGSPSLGGKRWFREFVDGGRVRYETRERANLNAARNAGLHLAAAPVVAYTDDDCVPAPDWCRQLLAAFALWPTAALVGGRIDLRFLDARPDWVRGPLLNYLSAVDLGAEPHPLRQDEWLAGANMAVRRDAVAALGGFDESIGMMDEDPQMIGNDEMELVRRIDRYPNLTTVYQPHAVVEHAVEGGRLTPEHFERRRYGQGRADFLLDRTAPGIASWDDAWRYLKYRLCSALSHLEEAGVEERIADDPHHAVYLRCTASLVLGFYHCALEHLPQAARQRRHAYALGAECARFYRDNGCTQAAVLQEVSRTLFALAAGPRSGQRIEEHLHAHIGYLEGVLDAGAGAHDGGTVNTPADDETQRLSEHIAAALAAPEKRVATRLDRSPTAPRPDFAAVVTDASVIAVGADRGVLRIHATLVRSTTGGDDPIDPQGALERADLTLAPKATFHGRELGALRILDRGARPLDIRRRADVAALCACIRGCLELPVSATHLAQYRSRMPGRRRFWTLGMQTLLERSAAAAGRFASAEPDALLASVAEAHDNVARLPPAWQPRMPNHTGSYRVDPESGVVRLLCEDLAALRPRHEAAAALLDRLAGAQSHFEPRELAAMILPPAPGGPDAARESAGFGIAWCRVAIMLDRLSWAARRPDRGSAADPPPDADDCLRLIGEFDHVLGEARSYRAPALPEHPATATRSET